MSLCCVALVVYTSCCGFICTAATSERFRAFPSRCRCRRWALCSCVISSSRGLHCCHDATCCCSCAAASPVWQLPPCRCALVKLGPKTCAGAVIFRTHSSRPRKLLNSQASAPPSSSIPARLVGLPRTTALLLESRLHFVSSPLPGSCVRLALLRRRRCTTVIVLRCRALFRHLPSVFASCRGCHICCCAARSRRSLHPCDSFMRLRLYHCPVLLFPSRPAQRASAVSLAPFRHWGSGSAVTRGPRARYKSGSAFARSKERLCCPTHRLEMP